MVGKIGKGSMSWMPEGQPPIPSTGSLLRWVYVGRLSVAITVFIAASLYFAAIPGVLVAVATAAIASLLVTGASFMYTHFWVRPPGLTFLYIQAIFDLGLVTTVVHVTGGVDSDFASLYILVIAFSSVVMPFTSSFLVTLFAAVLYVADVVFGNPVQLSLALWMQVSVFILVALATGYLASRVRVVGQARSKLEKEVRRLRLEAGDILRQIGSGVVTVDGDGDLVFANAAADRLFGRSTEQYVRQPFMEVLQRLSPGVSQAIATTQRERKRLIRFPGMVVTEERTFPIGVTTTLHDSEPDEVPSVTAVFTDISEQLRLQELNRRTERLGAVAELSASLAHEIKNPLASIRSSVEQLGQSTAATEDERSLAELVIRESDRLSRLLTEFLEFARVKMATAIPVDLRQVVEAAVALVKKNPDCTNNTEISISGACSPIPGDEDLLHRVVMNLTLNAVQAAQGNVIVDIALCDAGEDELPGDLKMGPCVVLTVKDNGPGIPEDIRPRLFDPFVTGREGGTGLGLPVVQRAVEAHRGAIFVDSTVGDGTVFKVYLPKIADESAGVK